MYLMSAYLGCCASFWQPEPVTHVASALLCQEDAVHIFRLFASSHLVKALGPVFFHVFSRSRCLQHVRIWKCTGTVTLKACEQKQLLRIKVFFCWPRPRRSPSIPVVDFRKSRVLLPHLYSTLAFALKTFALASLFTSSTQEG